MSVRFHAQGKWWVLQKGHAFASSVRHPDGFDAFSTLRRITEWRYHDHAMRQVRLFLAREMSWSLALEPDVGPGSFDECLRRLIEGLALGSVILQCEETPVIKASRSPAIGPDTAETESWQEIESPPEAPASETTDKPFLSEAQALSLAADNRAMHREAIALRARCQNHPCLECDAREKILHETPT